MLVSSDIARIDPAEAFSARTHQLEPKTMRKENKLPLNEFVKISLNSTFRNPRRFILSFSCVSACLCLMIVSFGFMFSKDASLTNTFGKRYRYDCMAWFSSDTVLPLIQDLPGVEFVEPVISGFLTIESDSGSETAQINGLSTEEVLIHPMSLDGKDIPVPESGLIMDEGLARRLAVKAGENVKIDGHTVKIDAIAREMVNAIQYCSLSQAKQLGLDTVNAAAVRLDDEHSVSEFATEASSLSGFSYVVNLDKQKQDMRYSNKIMDIPTYLFTIFAVLTGFIIVYNMAIINLSERLREYATLRALGVHLHTMTLMSLIEAGTEFVCACLLGIPIGVVFMQNFLRALSSKGHDYPPMDSERIILLSCVLTLLCVLSGHLFTQNKIRKMDLPSILNSRE